MSVPGPLLLLIYSKTISYAPDLSLSLFKQRSQLSSIVASYAFTMLGFLAAGVALLLNFANSPAFKRYQRNHYLDIFFLMYFYCIFTLGATFLLSLMSLSENSAQWFMRFALAAACNSMVQVFMISFATISICKRALQGK